MSLEDLSSSQEENILIESTSRMPQYEAVYSSLENGVNNICSSLDLSNSSTVVENEDTVIERKSVEEEFLSEFAFDLD